MLHFYWFIFCLLTAAIIFSFFPQKKETIVRENNSLDGLRFILSTMVVFHHNLFSNYFFTYGSWDVKNHHIWILGPMGVNIFFIISGYLFGKLNEDVNVVNFFMKRFLRIAPVCVLSSLACITIAVLISIARGNQMNFDSLYYWFDVGISNIRPPVSGVNYASLINAGVTWTLVYEWFFYFSIPFLSILVKAKYRPHLCVFIIAWAAQVGTDYNPRASIFIILFSIGVLVRNLDLTKITAVISTRKNTFNIILLCLMLSIPTFIDNPNGGLSIIIESLILILVVCGSDLFGILKSKGFNLLGEASYSLYLLHGILWFLMNMICFKLGVQNKALEYFIIQTLTWYLICLISVFCFKKIETPFIMIGKKFK